MNQRAISADWRGVPPRFESGAAHSWTIEETVPGAAAQDFVPFFPDQNGRVYEQLLYNLPVILHCMDGMGRLTSANDIWIQTFGYGKHDFTGKLFPDLLTPESRQYLVQTIYPRYFQSGACRNEELAIVRKDGTIANVLLSMNAYRRDKGRIERSICVMQDITARRIAEIASRRSEQRFRGAFEAAAHGMALVAPDGRIMMTNGAFKELIGRPPEDYDTTPFESLLDTDDRTQFLYAMKRLVTGEVPSLQQELRYLGPKNKIVFGFTSVSLVRDERKDIDHLVIQIVDMSSRRQAEMQLQHAQKMEAIGQLTGGLAHDFNNLLTVIVGNLQLIESATVSNEKAHRRVTEAIDAAQKGSELTRQLLAFARRQTLEPREVSINTLVQSMTPLISRSLGDNLDLKVDLMEGDPKSVIDPTQLESAMLNLAINARDAMGDTGQLIIETQPAHLDEAYAARHPDVTPGHYVMVAVSDTGSGIPPELMEKVFNPFFTTKANGKGSGLGLSMVYGFIKQSGGHIQIYSEVGRGTSIKMYLPRKYSAGEPASVPEVAHVSAADGIVENTAAVSEPEHTPGKAKILVVEDQEAVRAVACGFLMSFGYDIIEANDGFQALSMLQEHPDIDLMFSDVVMPGGMNGFDLAQAAYTIRPDLKIVHTSGYPKGAMVHQEEPRFRDGFIIMKPYRREDLEKIIGEALEAPVPAA
ncbi:hypothetical protein BH10PSE7_BH10PSE7_28880 [soil metagenome]